MNKLVQINQINIGLMLLSALLAYLFPFELFLVVYAFLGPLHYLTEINWLHQKKYFTTHSKDYFLHLILLVLLTTFLFSPVAIHLKKHIPLLVFIAFFSSFGMVYFKERRKKIFYYLSILLIGIIASYLLENKFNLVFSMFLPTLIHVFVFTGIFILFGALKDKSFSGKISLFIFSICAIVLLFLPKDFNYSIISNTIKNNYHSFEKLNKNLIIINKHFTEVTTFDVYFSEVGIQIMRFIAFAYTYHYFNWFSKTSIIQWHNTSRRKLVTIVLIWIISIGLYIYNYNTGLKWLYILSMAHVILEFPLNFVSIIGLKNIFKNSN